MTDPLEDRLLELIHCFGLDFNDYVVYPIDHIGFPYLRERIEFLQNLGLHSKLRVYQDIGQDQRATPMKDTLNDP